MAGGRVPLPCASPLRQPSAGRRSSRVRGPLLRPFPALEDERWRWHRLDRRVRRAPFRSRPRPPCSRAVMFGQSSKLQPSASGGLRDALLPQLAEVSQPGPISALPAPVLSTVVAEEVGGAEGRAGGRCCPRWCSRRVLCSRTRVLCSSILERLSFSCLGSEVPPCLFYKRGCKLTFEGVDTTLPICVIVGFRCQCNVPGLA